MCRCLAYERIPYFACAHLRGDAGQLHIRAIEFRQGAYEDVACGTVGSKRAAAEQRPAQSRNEGAIGAQLRHDPCRLRFPADEQEWVLDEIAPDAGKIGNRRDAMALKCIGGTYTREHEQPR